MKIGIIGLGLMGASLAKGLKKSTNNVIYGFDIVEEVIMRAKLLNIIDETLEDSNISSVEILFICTGLNESKEIIESVVPKLSPSTILVETVGVKESMVKLLDKKSLEYPQIDFLSLHAMAGREFSGIRHSVINLFDNAYIIFIPVKISLENTKKVKLLFEQMGMAGAKFTNAKEHDRYIAYTSQLPHILSNAYVKNPLALTSLGFTAGSFRDYTRVAKISSSMWTPLMIDNKENLLDAIKDLKDNLCELEQALIDSNSERLSKLLDEGNDKKQIVDRQKLIK